MYLSTITEWLERIGKVHSVEIDLGLDRVKKVAASLGLLTPSCPVITVGGTNGKGSTVAGLEAIYRAAGYRVGCFTSPILFKHNEYVRLNGQDASDESFCEAYEAIESARGATPLTPFEFHTLAALWMFQRSKLDVILLEVGLGGRLDAVNVIDADVSVVTSVSFDHMEWLGDSLEKIGLEKAGIFRPLKPAVCGSSMPTSLFEHASLIGAKLFRQGVMFDFKDEGLSWSWSEKACGTDPSFQDETAPAIDTHIPVRDGPGRKDSFLRLPVQLLGLPKSRLAIQNMSLVLMVVTLLQEKLPVERDAIDEGLRSVQLSGRIQIMPGDVTTIFDVSHNPGSVEMLAEKLKEMPCQGKTIAVFSMLADKDIESCVKLIKDQMDSWCIAPLKTQRAAAVDKLQEILKEQEITNVISFSSIKEAYAYAKKQAKKGDRIVIFGSFHTVAEGACNGCGKEIEDSQ